MEDLLDGCDTFDWEHDTIGEDEVRVPETEYVGPDDEPLKERMNQAQYLLDEEELVAHQIEMDDYNAGREILFDKLEESLERIKPYLAFTSSKVECLSAVEELREAFGEVLKGRRDRFVWYWRKYNSQVEAIKALDRRLRRDKEELGAAIDVRTERKLGDIAHQSSYEMQRQGDVESMREGEYDDWKRRVLELFQERIAKMVKEQPQKTGGDSGSSGQSNNPFSEHLNRNPGNLRPVVELQRGRKRSFEGVITPEVATMIYSYADVETCVQLREVSFFWYTSFQQAEQVLEPVVRRRSPWMQPSGDLLTWRDCALVFVKRLSSGKWTTTDLGNFRLDKEDRPVKMLTATIMDDGEKLPASFRGLDAQKDGKADYTEKRELLEFDYGEGHMNLKTLRGVELERDYQACVISFTEDSTVVKYKGMEIFLPLDVVLYHAPSHCPVTVNRETVIIRLQDRTCYVLPINKLHHKHATHFRSYRDAYELGNVVVKQLNSRSGHGILYYDVDDQKYVEFETHSRGAWPIASYNGLIWWYSRLESCGFTTRKAVFPTFVDMDDGKVYYRQDKSFDLPSDKSWEDLHQCTREQRFLICEFGRGLLLVDLATGTTTELINPHKARNESEEDDQYECEEFGQGVYVFPGFVGDNFDVRCLDPWTVMEYQREVRDGGDEDSEGDGESGEDDEDGEGDEDDDGGDDGDDGDDDGQSEDEDQEVIHLSDDDVIDLTGDD